MQTLCTCARDETQPNQRPFGRRIAKDTRPLVRIPASGLLHIIPEVSGGLETITVPAGLRWR